MPTICLVNFMSISYIDIFQKLNSYALRRLGGLEDHHRQGWDFSSEHRAQELWSFDQGQWNKASSYSVSEFQISRSGPRVWPNRKTWAKSFYFLGFHTILNFHLQICIGFPVLSEKVYICQDCNYFPPLLPYWTASAHLSLLPSSKPLHFV